VGDFIGNVMKRADAESDLTGALTSEYIYFNGKRIARVDNPGSSSASLSWHFADHLNSTSVEEASDFSSCIEDNDFYPFGGIASQNCTSGLVDLNHYLFTGKERDAETGDDYYGARYYASGLARYTSADWSAKPVPVPFAFFGNPQTLNLYSYVKNNPLSSFDDDGHVTIEVKYNPLAVGSNHSFIVMTDRDGTQTVFRAGPSVSANSSWVTPATGGAASQSSTPSSSQSDSSNSSSPGAGPTAQGNPFGQLYAQQESPTDPTGDNMSTISGSVTVLSNDAPAAGYINSLTQFDEGLNTANIPYNPLSTNNNSYVTNALQSLGVPAPNAPVWAPGAGTNLHVVPAPPAPKAAPPPPCSVSGACTQPTSN
jgi:RHS repeat-associated protein